MEGCERPESSKRSEISEDRHEQAEMSSKSQMGDRECAEAGSVPVPRRAVSNWERLVGPAVRADLEARDIKAVMEAADQIRNDDSDVEDNRVARILYDYAYILAREMGSLNQERGLLQFKSALKAIIMRQHMQRESKLGFTDRSEDRWVITAYISKLEEKEDIVNLNAEEQAARKVWAPEGEHSEHHAWKTEKLKRLYEIPNILNNVAKFLTQTTVSGIIDPFHHFSKGEDIVKLHQQLFSVGMEAVSCREPSTEEVKTISANFSDLHVGTLARDLDQFHDGIWINYLIKQFRNATSAIVLLGSLVLRRNVLLPLFMPLPLLLDNPEAMAVELLNLCEKKVQNSANYLSRKGAGEANVINWHQCDVLVTRLRWMEDVLVILHNPTHFFGESGRAYFVLGELLRILHDAEMLIKASCITTSQWPRAAFEQGDMNHTFLKILYELEWHTSVLLRMMSYLSPQYDDVLSEHLIKNGAQLNVKSEIALFRAMQKDKESLKRRLRSVEYPTVQGLVDQLRNRMEAPSSDLVFLNPGHFDHRGAGLIGSGSFGAVVETTFLGMDCAMKVIKGGLGTVVDSEFQKETNAAKKLGNHPHLVRLFCYSKTNDACYLIMERMQMNLEKVLRLKDKNGKGLSMVEAVALMLQIGEGLKHIHSKGAAHRDLKPVNILVNLADDSSEYLSRIRSVKIADFGLTKTQAAITCSNHSRNTGTSPYMAPEVMKLDGDDTGRTGFNPAKADVYSFAVVCSEILSTERPYRGQMSKEMKQQVKAGTLRPNLASCPARLTTLIKKCWDGDYNERPLLPEICRELRYIKGLLLMYMD